MSLVPFMGGGFTPLSKIFFAYSHSLHLPLLVRFCFETFDMRDASYLE